MNQRYAAIYIMANKQNGTLYTGVTNDLIRRVYEHKHNMVSGFTQKYECKLLVYFEFYEMIVDAITREKQIKAGPRRNKLIMIKSMNPNWRDLYKDLL